MHMPVLLSCCRVRDSSTYRCLCDCSDRNVSGPNSLPNNDNAGAAVRAACAVEAERHADIPVGVQRQVPMVVQRQVQVVQAGHKFVEDAQAQFIEKVMDIPTVTAEGHAHIACGSQERGDSNRAVSWTRWSTSPWTRQARVPRLKAQGKWSKWPGSFHKNWRNPQENELQCGNASDSSREMAACDVRVLWKFLEPLPATGSAKMLKMRRRRGASRENDPDPRAPVYFSFSPLRRLKRPGKEVGGRICRARDRTT